MYEYQAMIHTEYNGLVREKILSDYEKNELDRKSFAME